MNNIKTSPCEVIAVFPLPIYKTNIEREFTKQEQDEFDAIVREQLMVFRDTNDQSIISKNVSKDKYLLNRKSFLSIQSFIEHHLKEFVTTVLGIDTNKTSWAPQISHSWINVYKPKQYDDFHMHRNCVISGVLYINCLKNLAHGQTDGILFASTSHHMLEKFDLPTVEDTMFSDRPVHVSTVTGDLIIFPSSAHHSVMLNETSNQNRISLAFNVV